MLQLCDDIVEWQRENDCMRLPSLEEHRVLALGIQRYLEKDKQVRVSSMSQTFPSDVDAVQALHLDCLEPSEDMEGGKRDRVTRAKQLYNCIDRAPSQQALHCPVFMMLIQTF